MIYTIDLTRGVQVVSAGATGLSIWISPGDPLGTFRLGLPGGNVDEVSVANFTDGRWYLVEESEDLFTGEAWWVRMVSWTQIEVEYRHWAMVEEARDQ